jgi:hypothetical protein
MNEEQILVSKVFAEQNHTTSADANEWVLENWNQMETVSNVSKLIHDAAKSAINNVR